MENQEKTHKRRVRYSGTHPKNYKEKYKEHNPEKYADTIAKVIQKGSTPAGMHISIMVQEILHFLDIVKLPLLSLINCSTRPKFFFLTKPSSLQ